MKTSTALIIVAGIGLYLFRDSISRALNAYTTGNIIKGAADAGSSIIDKAWSIIKPKPDAHTSVDTSTIGSWVGELGASVNKVVQGSGNDAPAPGTYTAGSIF